MNILKKSILLKKGWLVDLRRPSLLKKNGIKMGLKCCNSLKTHVAKMPAFFLSRIFMKTHELYRFSRMLMKINGLQNVPVLGVEVTQFDVALQHRGEILINGAISSWIASSNAGKTFPWDASVPGQERVSRRLSNHDFMRSIFCESA